MEKTKKKKSEGVFETIRTVIYAVLIALVVRTFAYEPFNIPSGSMIPTLLIGDYLFVSKFSYGYSRYSLPMSPPLFSGRLFSSPPKRGDVAVFKLPSDNSTDYIKRIIGLPGDRIQVIDGVLHLNGAPVPRRRLADKVQTNRFGNSRHIRRYRETLPGGASYVIWDQANTRLDNTDVFAVPQGHYFMMGDNRDNSSDSRVSRGHGGVCYVPAENLVGRAEFLFFSTNGGARLWQVWKWPSTVRYGRLLDAVR